MHHVSYSLTDQQDWEVTDQKVNGFVHMSSQLSYELGIKNPTPSDAHIKIVSPNVFSIGETATIITRIRYK